MIGASVANIFIRVSSVGLYFLINVQLSRTLGPEQFGIFSYTMAWLQILSLIVAFGLPSSLLRSVALSMQDPISGRVRDTVFSAFALMAIIGIAIAIVAAGWALMFGLPRGGKVVMIPAVLLATVLALGPVVAGALRGLGLVVWSQIPEQLLRPGLFCLSLAFLLLWGTHLTVARTLWAQIGTALMALMAGFALLMRHIPKSEASICIRPFKQARVAMPFMLLSLVQGLYIHASFLFLGQLVGNAELALFKVAVQITDALNLILIGISVVIGPMIVRYNENEDWVGLQQLIVRAHRGGAFLLLGPILLLTICARLILGGLFGESYISASAALQILLLGKIVYALVGFSGLVLSMSGKARVATLATMLGLVSTIAMMAIFVPRYGLKGAALAMTSGAFVTDFVCMLIIYRSTGRGFSALNLTSGRERISLW